MLQLCPLDAIPDGDAIGVATPDGEVVLVRQGQQVFAYRNSCPHLGIELNFQPDVFLDTERQYIHCINHGALFRIADGLCVYGPCNGDSLTPLDVQIVDNAVWLSSGRTGQD